MVEEEKKSLNFLEQIVENDLATGKHNGRILTRFPPEPNGYLHIGHAKSICLNFGLAQKYNGQTNLRFDDTNPSTEDSEYVDSIQNDVRWLGFDWSSIHYTSDYFEQLYNFAITLINKGLAYIDDSTAEQIATQKGTPTKTGTNSPFRERSINENLELFANMRAGQYPDGAKVLRAKINMASPNMHFRDPIMYRIKHAHHHRTGNDWCIYPMYDFAHGQSDAIENITHSICTLEFEVHRPVYEWYIQQLGIFTSQQYEFARLNLSYTIMSKRKLLQLVNEQHVSGWNDPRMPTISGLRRRGYTPVAIRNFCEMIGVARRDNLIDVGKLEFCIREDLNKSATRMMAVLDPIKLVISNYPENKTEELPFDNNPENETAGQRMVAFGRELWIERDDFLENPPKGFFRLGPGLMTRLKGAYIVKCDDFVKDDHGQITEIRCSYIPESKSGSDTSGLKVKGTIHWVNVQTAQKAEVRLYDRLFTVEDLNAEDGDFKDYINPNSLKILPEVYIEPALGNAQANDRFQFIRKGYFCLDTDSQADKLVFNQTVGLKDSYNKK